MTSIGIMSAMHEELAAVLDVFPDKQCVRVAGRDFWLGNWHGHSLVVVLSRIGKVAAATTATVLVEHFGVKQIVFTGVAGGIGTGLRVGDVVLAHSFVQHDMDASPLFPRHEVPLYGLSHFETDKALSARLGSAAQTILADVGGHVGADAVDTFALQAPRLHEGLIASGDQFVSDASKSHGLRQDLPEVLAVEMEGAAVAQVCADYEIPFAALRTISDYADDNASADFSRFIREVASLYSQAMLSEWLRAGA
ncbi:MULTISPECIES: 5'-methylthioadenosine/adenosylhomocysteine nucleosidase [unclassified Haematospirillum]|uniref:5'-methylthioadenosine/adenosylhomocysteine nucleosidase n=1 Tax=unclassified Haematospirillum TaxID=2622088 RepID=UPI00143A8896|nr:MULTISPECIES: 5'-methylthioadenosine/adenosylhomocysteine nucleosidase [unclassified Haematospirillum]NKD55044.1 5'-methylthioadenosine/adenosylhomocysteine nucleosidase [Haematospirillum sp. H4890]NKD76060.1 5'-methylthioadenosine/adenosylhomocysteine nucleosidase [Haematospirillum sp. H4485]NKD88652.1 5'-methylthioadenosine/adenosylhomocysteine nucleosidase [Haematospirillum sp. 15-248]